MFTLTVKAYGHGILRKPGLISTTSFQHFSRHISSAKHPPLLLSPSQVHELTKSPDHNLSFLDATWFMPNSPRNARKEYLAQRLPNAQFFDLDEVASPHVLGLKHMMPSPQLFADACGIMGIKPSSHVVIYDAHGVFSSPRALFTFKMLGHDNASIIDGGLPRWLVAGLPTESGEPNADTPKTAYPPPNPSTTAIRSYEQVVSNSQLELTEPGVELVLDARSYGRFIGNDAEPRPGLSSGHIPHSLSLPFNTFLRQNNGPNNTTYTTFLPREDIRAALIHAVGPELAESIINGNTQVVTTCGSGMTAAVLWLGLQLLGAKSTALYDESWTGYASRKESVIVTSI